MGKLKVFVKRERNAAARPQAAIMAQTSSAVMSKSADSARFSLANVGQVSLFPLLRLSSSQSPNFPSLIEQQIEHISLRIWRFKKRRRTRRWCPLPSSHCKVLLALLVVDEEKRVLSGPLEDLHQVLILVTRRVGSGLPQKTALERVIVNWSSEVGGREVPRNKSN